MTGPGRAPSDLGDDAISAGLYPLGAGRHSALLFSSRFITTAEHRPMLMYQPRASGRVAVEWLMRVRLVCQLLSWGYFYFFVVQNAVTKHKPYIDELHDFLFFMDGNVSAKRIARRYGFSQPTIQQTFFIPAGPSGQAQGRLVEWLEVAHDIMGFYDLAPTIQDVLYLPADRPFYLSTNPGQEGFAVSYAFETSDEDALARIDNAFIELADVLWKHFRGRVSLVKNVRVKPDTLEQMYSSGATQFFDVKKAFDPNCVLRNDFL